MTLKHVLDARCPRLAYCLSWLTGRKIRRWLMLRNMDTQAVFTHIYRNNLWYNPETRSGAGSTLTATANLRAALPSVLRDLNVRSMLDAACGDFHWMSQVDLPVQQYIGGDVVPELVAHLQATYGNDQRRFICLDIIDDPLPAADLVLLRDVLLHLSSTQIHRVLHNLARAGIRFVMASNYPTTQFNAPNMTGGARPLNLCLKPFGLPPPVRRVDDPGEGVLPREMGIWTHQQIKDWSQANAQNSDAACPA